MKDCVSRQDHFVCRMSRKSRSEIVAISSQGKVDTGVEIDVGRGMCEGLIVGCLGEVGRGETG